MLGLIAAILDKFNGELILSHREMILRKRNSPCFVTWTDPEHLDDFHIAVGPDKPQAAPAHPQEGQR